MFNWFKTFKRGPTLRFPFRKSFLSCICFLLSLFPPSLSAWLLMQLLNRLRSCLKNLGLAGASVARASGSKSWRDQSAFIFSRLTMTSQVTLPMTYHCWILQYGKTIQYVQHVEQCWKQTGSEGEHRGHFTVNNWRCLHRDDRITGKTTCISSNNWHCPKTTGSSTVKRRSEADRPEFGNN